MPQSFVKVISPSSNTLSTVEFGEQPLLRKCFKGANGVDLGRGHSNSVHYFLPFERFQSSISAAIFVRAYFRFFVPGNLCPPVSGISNLTFWEKIKLQIKTVKIVCFEAFPPSIIFCGRGDTLYNVACIPVTGIYLTKCEGGDKSMDRKVRGREKKMCHALCSPN